MRDHDSRSAMCDMRFGTVSCDTYPLHVLIPIVTSCRVAICGASGIPTPVQSFI